MIKRTKRNSLRLPKFQTGDEIGNPNKRLINQVIDNIHGFVFTVWEETQGKKYYVDEGQIQDGGCNSN